MSRAIFAAILGVAAAILGAAAASSSASAADWSILGGRTLDPSRTALRIAAGWPDVHAAYHMPLSRDIEIAPKVGLLYGYPSFGQGSDSTFVGNSFGAELRWNVFSSGGFHLAAKGELGFQLYYNIADEFDAGLRVSPGVVADYEVTNKVNLTTGLEIPIDFILSDPVFALIPILFNIGVEFQAKDDLILFFAFKMGPALGVVESESDAGFGFDGKLGLAFLF
jgi:hypothetical protein